MVLLMDRHAPLSWSGSERHLPPQQASRRSQESPERRKARPAPSGLSQRDLSQVGLQMLRNGHGRVSLEGLAVVLAEL
jgi:hypothetical protein